MILHDTYRIFHVIPSIGGVGVWVVVLSYRFFSKVIYICPQWSRRLIRVQRFPKLNPGASLPKAPIKSQGAVSRISDPSLLVPSSDRKLANTSAAAGGVPLVDPALSKKKLKEVFIPPHHITVFLIKYFHPYSHQLDPTFLASAYDENSH